MQKLQSTSSTDQQHKEYEFLVSSLQTPNKVSSGSRLIFSMQV